MNFIQKINAIPALQRLRAKHDFIASVAVSLRSWDQRDEASEWCELHWQTSDRQYRRKVKSSQQSAVFEFPDIEEAMEFHLRFGSRAWNC